MLKLKESLLEFKDNIYTVVNQKYVSVIGIILQAVMFITIGVLILNIESLIGSIVIYSIASIIIANAILSILKDILNKKEKLKIINILKYLSLIGAGVYFLYHPELFIEIFPLLFTGYIAIDSIIKTITVIIAFESKLDGKFSVILKTLISYIFLIILLIYPLLRLNITIILSGIYFIIFGIDYIIDGIYLSISNKNKVKAKSKFKLVLPVFISAFIPYRVLNEINKLFYVKDAKKVVIKKDDECSDVQILIHIKDIANNKFGHVDIAIDSKVYSYGSYDESKVIFSSAIGHGVLFEVDKNKYIEFCTTNEHKSIIEYGIKLKLQDKKKLLKKIKNIKDDSFKWRCLADTDKDKSKNDYASRLYKATKAKFFKFSKGNFKTYFTLSTNCVKLVDTLLKEIDSEVMTINGVIAPGAYYDYLNRMFKRKNTIVISKEIHLNKTVK